MGEKKNLTWERQEARRFIDFWKKKIKRRNLCRDADNEEEGTHHSLRIQRRTKKYEKKENKQIT